MESDVFGVVVAFDEQAGTGTVTAEDGRTFAFHCTSVLDGSRHVAVGTRVGFDVVPSHLGRWEAAGVWTVSQSPGVATPGVGPGPSSDQDPAGPSAGLPSA